MTHLRLGLLTILACVVFYGCAPKQDPASAPIESDAKPEPSSASDDEAPPVVLEAPVAFWRDGKAQGQVDAAKADENVATKDSIYGQKRAMADAARCYLNAGDNEAATKLIDGLRGEGNLEGLPPYLKAKIEALRS